MKGCILFLKLVESLVSLPANVEALVKDRIQHQFQEQLPNVQLQFDTGNCSNRGSYELRERIISLSAANEVWSGERIYSYSEILEGKKLTFLPVIDVKKLFEVHRNESPPTNAKLESSLSFGRGLLIAGIIAAVATVVIKQQQNSAPAPKTFVNNEGSTRISVEKESRF